MKIAIIGSGVSGLSAAYLLDQKYDVTVYESEDNIGGHVHTIPVTDGKNTIWVDTGFIVCNSKNYPNFLHLMELLEVKLQNSNMSFSVSTPNNKLEYNGTSINGLFAQRSNLFKPKFYQMLADIIKFNAVAKEYAKSNNYNLSIGQLVSSLKLKHDFKSYYLAPMIAAIWSSDQSSALNMPALFVCRFLDNHGMLNINDRPQWYSIINGSHTYIKAITSKLKNKIRNSTKVNNIIRNANNVTIQTNNDSITFDKVIIATHSDQALKLINKPSEDEYSTLSSMRYQSNDVVLHTDINLLPRNRRAWASWNYRLLGAEQDRVCVTYNMNMLQNIKSSQIFCVSLNQTAEIATDKIIASFKYSHPIYDEKSTLAQKNHSLISGKNNTYYCGAYWGNGFHEDGLNSALKVIEQIDRDILCTTQFSTAK